MIEASLPFIFHRRKAYRVESGDVMIANISENNEDKVTFLLYIVVSDGRQVLAGDALESLVKVS